ncbi:hypothetical protein V492_06233 [Pseudogymnoascus sp. VKM F-4246]|nr:hypothetical protein V492_06233 [Pseudogymnoascus sp. VKM F-4246]
MFNWQYRRHVFSKTVVSRRVMPLAKRKEYQAHAALPATHASNLDYASVELDVRYHANLYPCNEGTGADNPKNWWCGSTTLKTCSPDEGTLFEFRPGNVARIVPYASSSKTVESSAETSSPTSTSPSSTPSSSDPTGVAAEESACPIVEEKAKIHLANMMAAVGAGVGVPLLALALAFIGLFVKERRLRKKLTVAKDVDGAGAAYGSDKGTYQIQDYGQGQDQRQIQSEYKAKDEMSTGQEFVELGGHHPVHELTGGHQRPIRGSIHELGSNYR